MADFSDTCEAGFTIGQDLDLTNVISCLTWVVVIYCVPKLALCLCDNSTTLMTWHIGDASDSSCSSLEIFILVTSLLSSLQLQGVEGN